MGFLIQCNNKGCGEMQNAYVDQDSGEVYCSSCDKVIDNVSEFTKRQMRSMKQYRPKSKHTFAVKCLECKTDVQPKLSEDKIVCSKCESPLNSLTPFFIKMLKQKLKSQSE